MKLSNHIYAGTFVPALVRLMDNPDLTLAERWPLIKLAQQLEVRAKSYNSAAKMIADKYAEDGEEGRMVPASKATAFNNDMAELHDIEDEYDVPQLPVAIDVARLYKQGSKLLATDLVILAKILTIDEASMDALCDKSNSSDT